MYTLTMRFTLPPDTDWSKIPALLEERARQFYANVPGLVAKAFLYDPESREYGGNYVWETREHIEAFLRSDVVAAARQRFGEPRYSIHHVAAYLDHGRVMGVEELERLTPASASA